MKPRLYVMPNTGPLVTADGYPAQAFAQYLRGIEDLSKRSAATIAPLAPAATDADIITKINELIAAMQAAGQMRS